MEETVQGISLKLSDIVDFVRNDEDQVRIMGALSEKRNLPLDLLIDAGIFYVPDLDELDYLGELAELSFPEMGIYSDNERMYLNGFIIPVMDSMSRIIFYINYSFERDSSKKYINIYPHNYSKDTSIRLYGMDSFKRSLKYDTVVAVEGSFDRLRLEAEGIPTVAMLGTKLTSMQVNYLERFKRIIYVEDNDESGEVAYQRLKSRLTRVERYQLYSGYEDVDHFGSTGGSDYREWVTKLKRMVGVPDQTE